MKNRCSFLLDVLKYRLQKQWEASHPAPDPRDELAAIQAELYAPSSTDNPPVAEIVRTYLALFGARTDEKLATELQIHRMLGMEYDDCGVIPQWFLKRYPDGCFC